MTNFAVRVLAMREELPVTCGRFWVGIAGEAGSWARAEKKARQIKRTPRKPRKNCCTKLINSSLLGKLMQLTIIPRLTRISIDGMSHHSVPSQPPCRTLVNLLGRFGPEYDASSQILI